MLKTLNKTSYVCVNAVDRIANILSRRDYYRKRQQDHRRYAPENSAVRTCQHRFKLWIIYCYQWSLNTELSMWMWETLMRVFNLRNMSSMMRFLFLKIIQHDLRFLWWDNKYLTLIKGCKHVAVWVFGRVSQLRRGWQVIKICACEIWEETDSGSNVGY